MVTILIVVPIHTDNQKGKLLLICNQFQYNEQLLVGLAMEKNVESMSGGGGGLPTAEITGGCRPPDVDAGNGTQVLWTNWECS